MEYKENALCYKDYCGLRASAGWLAFSPEQAQRALDNSLYTITAVEDGQTVGMGRLAGDGMYYLIVDVVVAPAYRNRGIGTRMAQMLAEYVAAHTPAGGRSSIQLIAEAGKEPFYEKLGFKRLPKDGCGCGMRRVIHR